MLWKVPYPGIVKAVYGSFIEKAVTKRAIAMMHSSFVNVCCLARRTSRKNGVMRERAHRVQISAKAQELVML